MDNQRPIKRRDEIVRLSVTEDRTLLGQLNEIIQAYTLGAWSYYWREMETFLYRASDDQWDLLISILDDTDERRGEPPSVPVTASGLHCAQKNK